jgi:hypothetical protein
MIDAPKLLIEWSSPWREFWSAIGPAMSRSAGPLAGEAPTQIFPWRGWMLAWAVEGLVLAALMFLPAHLLFLQPFTPPQRPKYDIIYYSGEELPQTHDESGARQGKQGKAGGREAFHRTQVIRVARGERAVEKVIDAPKLDLPKSSAPVANLLAIQRVPGPPPAEGLRSSAPALTIPSMAAVAPPPELAQSPLRKTPSLNTSVIPPTPTPPDRDIAAARFPVLKTEVVPPPVSAPAQNTLNPRLALPAPSAVAPAPVLSGNISRMSGTATMDIRQDVVPPPAQVNPGNVTGRNIAGLPTQVVPPPPTVTGGTTMSGRGAGHSGGGLGGLLDVGSTVAPPAAAGGTSEKSAVVISSQPGMKVGAPTSAGGGAIAMSPAGGAKPGLGGIGGSEGVGRGNGPGSAKEGEGPGSGRTGTGIGSSTIAKTGIAPGPVPGGAGTGARNGTPATPGVSVEGGSIITLPSFGSSTPDPSAAARSSIAAGKHGPDITVEATPSSGGVFRYYNFLKGDSYSIYLTTVLGTALLQFSDPSSLTHNYADKLTAPEPISINLPALTSRARLIIYCVIDKAGELKQIKVLEGANTLLGPRVVPALTSWKFRPALRGEQPVEVTAILGFNVDTR